MDIECNELIYITRTKGDHQVGNVKFLNLEGFRWDTISGGVRQNTGNYGLYAYVWCNDIEGKIGHSCAHGSAPHYIKVYIPKQMNSKIYNHLATLAGEKPKNPYQYNFNVSDKVRQFVLEKPGITAVEIANILEKENVRKKTVQNAIRYLKTHEYKNKPNLTAEKFGNTQKLFIKII